MSREAGGSGSPAPSPFVEGSVEDFVLSGGESPYVWEPGERLQHLFERAAAEFDSLDAIATDSGAMTYGELDRRSNQAARLLLNRGLGPGDRVGLLFDRTVETYVALLAVLKINAAYVPLDPSFPVERIRFIAEDAALKAVLSVESFAESLGALDLPRVMIDAARHAIDAQPHAPLTEIEVGTPVDEVCYLIYTSGTTGAPKGVVIEHRSICTFVQAAARRYGYRPGDRVYQGMTIAFDFSVEEIWVPLMTGATLVPTRQGASLVGFELSAFLRERRATCLACCPTLLATIEEELPDLRLLIVGGEACPQNLVRRWSRAGRTILNTYGPTETTVTATVAELLPSKPVTIGRPLPTYSVVILDPRTLAALKRGELGEIGVAGVGVAAGYRNRDELTAEKFIPDFLGIADNASNRIYRTGDLGRINAEGEIEYHGRIDTQVKIRGYRIETAEIEAALLDCPQIAQAAVSTHEVEPGMPELVGYYALKQGETLSRAEIAQTLRARLPAYMVPAFLEELPFIPMLISNKADHKKLPKPKGARAIASSTLVEASTEVERIMAAALAESLGLERVSVADHFFNDLGANSLLMARFCAKVRNHPGMSSVSMRDIYQNPTIAKLASRQAAPANENVEQAGRRPAHTPSDASYFLCGGLQLAFYATYGLATLALAAAELRWTYQGVHRPLDLYLRSVLVAAMSFGVLTALPVAAKWLLIGRFKAERFPIWSLKYFRFWVVKTLVQTAPPVLFRNSPIFNAYLRLLGARIGRGAVLNPRFVPVCADLLTVGENAILRKDSIALCYRARANFIETGPVEIGRHAYVGTASVLDIDTAMGHRTQLGHASSLQSGQRVPDGKHFHGSPAVETKSDFCPIDSKNCSSLRRRLYALLQLAGLFGVLTPAPIMAMNYWYPLFRRWVGLSKPHAGQFGMPLWMESGLFSAGALAATLVFGLAAICILPRLCNRFLKPGRTYPLYGVHYFLQTCIDALSNSAYFNLLFGDTSAVVAYLRFIGWRLGKVEQTGSNFGTNQRHDNPFLCEIGSGTMASDGLAMVNMHMSSTSFRLTEARIGDRNYLGNGIHYPPDGRTGENCLLASRVMVPIDGPVRENVGLLGSPCFEIPRAVNRDLSVNAALDEKDRRRWLKMKNAHNLATAALFLVSQWTIVSIELAVAQLGVINYARFGNLALLGAMMLDSVIAVVFFTLLERASTGFRRLRPRMASIYDPNFWSHERYWKLSHSPIMQLFGGTPFRSLILRLMGVKVGRKIFDACCSITETSLTELGDGVNLNEGSVIQAHSLEEGVFKSDYVAIGAGSTIGVNAFVHYGVTIGEQVCLEADSFLMKGEMLDGYTVWRGNPATLVSADAARSHAPQPTRVEERRPEESAFGLAAARVVAE